MRSLSSWSQKGAKVPKPKIRKSRRNFDEFGIVQSHRIPQNPTRHARDISRTKKNLRIAFLNPDQQQIDSLVTPPKIISGSFLNLLIPPPPQCSQIWGVKLIYKNGGRVKTNHKQLTNIFLWKIQWTERKWLR